MKYFYSHIRTNFILNSELVSTLKGMLQNQPAPTIQPPPQGSTAGHGKLVIPPPVPQANQINFEGVKFWTRNNWVNYTQRCQEQNKECKKLGFLTTEDGKAVDDTRIKAMTDFSKQLWHSLRSENQDPDSWRTRTSFASDFYSASMHSKFPEFLWCEGDWKVHAFATIRYPDYIVQRKAGNVLYLITCIYCSHSL